MSEENPFFRPSELPYGLPPFDRIHEEHYLEAFARGMADQLAEIDLIAASSEPPTFENTLVPLERSGRLLDRVANVFFNLLASDAGPGIEAIDREISPRYTEHQDSIHLNSGLYRRLLAVDPTGLDAESTRLLEDYLRGFLRAGARLDDEGKRRLRGLNSELAALTSDFGRRLLAETNDAALVLDDLADLEGLPEDTIAAAAAAATARGHEGKYVLNLALPTSQPAITGLARANVRRALFEASVTRGARGNAHDTRAIVGRIAALRATKAWLLGFATHAEYRIAEQTAKTAEAAGALLARLIPPAVANARREQEAIALHTGTDEIMPWDVEYYAERLRRETFDLDDSELRPYLELEAVLKDGVFFAANRLYGITFSERHDLPTYHGRVRVFEVFDADGAGLGLFLADHYARPTKRGGAWMNTFVDQSSLLGTRSVVVNNLNIAPPAPGQPTLLSTGEVTTLFHEFGHALHALLSRVTYPRLSGTSVPRDFVEYPSQVNEMWQFWPEVFANYARHHETGDAVPQAWVERLQRSRAAGRGFETAEYLAAAVLDLVWHSLEDGEVIDDPLAFEAQALTAAGIGLPTVPPRYRSTYFNHIFSGGYSAGYYSYVWSEVLDADTEQWFRANGGLSRTAGEHFRRTLLSRGDSVDPMAAFRTFRGRDPEITPLLARLGLLETHDP